MRWIGREDTKENRSKASLLEKLLVLGNHFYTSENTPKDVAMFSLLKNREENRLTYDSRLLSGVFVDAG